MVTHSPERQSTRVPAADAFLPLLTTAFGPRPPVRFEFWDGSGTGPEDGPGTIRVQSPDAVRRMMWALGELGMGRAFVAGDLDIDGDIYGTLRALQLGAANDTKLGVRGSVAALRAAARLGVLGPPPAPPPEEARPQGWLHSRRRDAYDISHHYDVGNDFYRLVLGPSMTYSCARFTDPGTTTLEEAQSAKHELIARKLGLRQGMRLLDVGCGWGSLALHAAAAHGVDVVGVTISREQADLARQRVAEAGLTGQVQIHLRDYRELHGERFDAISSVGMFEHVGRKRMAGYFTTLRALLGPHGRLLNHAISSIGGSALGRHSFIGRYVFPDGELMDVGEVVLAMEEAGFEVRDVESLREHYALTLREWIANLESHWDEAVAIAGEARARIWRLYMAGSALGFEDGGVSIHQVLGVVPDSGGGAAMPPTRGNWP
jgi:cyclopropane-fatty-acyl-phospholipid synthase